MSVTYPEDKIEPIAEETFVPVYARRGRSAKKQGGVKTWMILAPIAAVAVIGGGALMFMGGSNEADEAALVEPAATAPVLPLTPAPTEVAAAPLASAATPAPVEATPQPAAAPAPVAREAAPVRRAAPAPAARRVAPAPTPPIETPVEPTGPRSYSAPAASSPSTSTLNTAPTAPAPTPAPRAPVIATQPLN